MKPRHIHVLDAIWHINAPAGQRTAVARVGDVSAFLDITTPSVTKLVNELVHLGMVEKHSSHDDRRAVTLTLTDSGLDCRRTYVEQYHARLVTVLHGLTPEQCDTTVRTLHTALRLMQHDRNSQRGKDQQ
ncbi:winged helix-turn-helix transcriptional regulator [Bifidobacterium callimiconis]|nr:winged helix-turn-helix transcriptional regulator [Bifidobacterium callimiconis]